MEEEEEEDGENQKKTSRREKLAVEKRSVASDQRVLAFASTSSASHSCFPRAGKVRAAPLSPLAELSIGFLLFLSSCFSSPPISVL